MQRSEIDQVAKATYSLNSTRRHQQQSLARVPRLHAESPDTLPKNADQQLCMPAPKAPASHHHLRTTLTLCVCTANSIVTATNNSIHQRTACSPPPPPPLPPRCRANSAVVLQIVLSTNKAHLVPLSRKSAIGLDPCCPTHSSADALCTTCTTKMRVVSPSPPFPEMGRTGQQPALRQGVARRSLAELSPLPLGDQLVRYPRGIPRSQG